MASWNGLLCVAWTGLDGHLNLMLVAWKAKARRGKGPLMIARLQGGRAPSALGTEGHLAAGPSLTAAGEVAVMTWPGRKGQIMAMAITPAEGPGSAVPLPGSLRQPGAGAVHNGELVLSWADKNRNLCVAPLQLS